VFPDKKECEYAVEDYGGDVPFYITPLDNPRVADLDVSVDKVFVMNPVFDVREYVNTEALWTQVSRGSLFIHIIACLPLPLISRRLVHHHPRPITHARFIIQSA
jgi:hypothetical protein